MIWPGSLQARLALGLGLALSLVWLAATAWTLTDLRRETEKLFDSALQETAQRLLPLAVTEIVNRDPADGAQTLAPISAHEEFFTYIVRDRAGDILMRSHSAEPGLFPAWDGPGFATRDTHRFYSEATLQGAIRLTVAEPLAERQNVLRAFMMRLGLPLMLALPLTLIIVVIVVRLGLGGLRRFGADLTGRGARHLSPVPVTGLPSDLRPLADTVNDLLARLSDAFEAERSFAANAAHELRTPLAGAIAQAQRLRAETDDPATDVRAADIEATLKRLTRLCERLMQLARAEGGRLRLDHSADLRPVARVVVEDLARMGAVGRITLSLPDSPVLSDIDPDAFAILCRNLVENALRHGAATAPVEVSLDTHGRFTVANDGPVVPRATRARLTARFARAGTEGSGLGLAIVAAIADRTGSPLVLDSPRPGQRSGFEVSLRLPTDPSDGSARHAEPPEPRHPSR